MKVVVLIPCFNEEATIGAVVRSFSAALPDATIYVYDNNSTDRTRQIAAAAGANVCNEPRQGKGNVVRRMFANIDADIYVLVDGDDTYDATSAPKMIEQLRAGQFDMISGARIPTSPCAHRPGHLLGNRVLSWLVGMIFGQRFRDILSGYRVFSHRFVKSFPALSTGFEVETEFTVHALGLRIPSVEMKTPYRERPQGSVSKLHTFNDAFRILWLIFRSVEEERPLHFYGILSFLFALSSLGLFYRVFVTFAATGLAPGLSTIAAGSILMVLAFVSLFSGLILDIVVIGQRNAQRLRYLELPPPPAARTEPIT